MAPTLYYNNASPPVRGVLMTAAALELELDLKEVNLFAGEHMTAEYLKINPMHSIPTLDDDGYILWDSHAVAGYLVNKYGQDDALYPKDPNQRGTIDQRLHFDGGVVFPRMSTIFAGILFHGDTSISQEKLVKVHEAYGLLETFLDGHDWLAGDSMTIADLCTVASVSSLNAFIPIDATDFPLLSAWLERCSQLPCYEQANVPGLEKLTGALKSKLE